MATANPFVATSPDIIVAKGKKSVASAILLVAISSSALPVDFSRLAFFIHLVILTLISSRNQTFLATHKPACAHA